MLSQVEGDLNTTKCCNSIPTKDKLNQITYNAFSVEYHSNIVLLQ